MKASLLNMLNASEQEVHIGLNTSDKLDYDCTGPG